MRQESNAQHTDSVSALPPILCQPGGQNGKYLPNEQNKWEKRLLVRNLYLCLVVSLSSLPLRSTPAAADAEEAGEEGVLVLVLIGPEQTQKRLKMGWA
jgi:hypothetical protein